MGRVASMHFPFEGDVEMRYGGGVGVSTTGGHILYMEIFPKRSSKPRKAQNLLIPGLEWQMRPPSRGDPAFL